MNSEFLTSILGETEGYYNHVMEVNGFSATLQSTAPLRQREQPYGLPGGMPLSAFRVDALPGCPEDWIRGAGSYVCPVEPDTGLWFKWTSNDKLNTAILPSVKGINPITGRKIDSLALEQYRSKCPQHLRPLQGDGYCPLCKYKIPPQNYVSSPNTLWWDGFRQPDGTVRQFLFTEEIQRDIAKAIFKKVDYKMSLEPNLIPAFGFVFYETKVRREPQRTVVRGKMVSSFSGCFGFSGQSGISGISGYSGLRFSGPSGPSGPKGPAAPTTSLGKLVFSGFSGQFGASGTSGPSGISGLSGFAGKKSGTSSFKQTKVKGKYQGTLTEAKKESGYSGISGYSPQGASGFSGTSGISGHLARPCNNPSCTMCNPRQQPGPRDLDKEAIRSLIKANDRRHKNVAVAAGARIRQELKLDPLPVTEWKDEPSGIMRVYFVFPLEFAKILEKGGIRKTAWNR